MYARIENIMYSIFQFFLFRIFARLFNHFLDDWLMGRVIAIRSVLLMCWKSTRNILVFKAPQSKRVWFSNLEFHRHLVGTY